MSARRAAVTQGPSSPNRTGHSDNEQIEAHRRTSGAPRVFSIDLPGPSCVQTCTSAASYHNGNENRCVEEVLVVIWTGTMRQQGPPHAPPQYGSP